MLKASTIFCVLAAIFVGGQAAAATQAPASEPIPATFFGLHLIHPPTPWPAISFGSRRFWDSGTRWMQLQSNTSTSQPSFDWSPLDSWLSQMQAHNLLDAMYNLGATTPTWLSSCVSGSCTQTVCDDNAGGCYPPRDIAANCTDANAMGTCDGKADGTDLGWRQWVAAVSGHLKASKYGVRIDAYEPWNEFTRVAGQSGVVQGAWQGSNVQMVRLCEDARCIVTGRGSVTATKETCSQVLQSVGLSAPVDPSAIMLSPSTGAVGPEQRNFYAYTNTSGASAAAEAISIHAYIAPVLNNVEPEIDTVHTFSAGLNAVDRAKPMWSSEGGMNNLETQNPTILSDPDEQMAFVARYYLIVSTLGLVRANWYAYDLGNAWGTLWIKNGATTNTNDANQITCHETSPPYGLGSGNGCLLPLGRAYQKIYDWMVGNTLTTPCAANGKVYTCGMTKPDGSLLLAVWDTSQSCASGVCTHSNYTVDPKYIQYYDMDTTTSHPVSGGQVQIGAKPILLATPVAPAVKSHPRPAHGRPHWRP
jgi:hypothetical protein